MDNKLFPPEKFDKISLNLFFEKKTGFLEMSNEVSFPPLFIDKIKLTIPNIPFNISFGTETNNIKDLRTELYDFIINIKEEYINKYVTEVLKDETLIKKISTKITKEGIFLIGELGSDDKFNRFSVRIIISEDQGNIVLGFTTGIIYGTPLFMTPLLEIELAHIFSFLGHTKGSLLYIENIPYNILKYIMPLNGWKTPKVRLPILCDIIYHNHLIKLHFKSWKSEEELSSIQENPLEGNEFIKYLKEIEEGDELISASLYKEAQKFFAEKKELSLNNPLIESRLLWLKAREIGWGDELELIMEEKMNQFAPKFKIFLLGLLAYCESNTNNYSYWEQLYNFVSDIEKKEIRLFLGKMFSVNEPEKSLKYLENFLTEDEYLPYIIKELINIYGRLKLSDNLDKLIKHIPLLDTSNKHKSTFLSQAGIIFLEYFNDNNKALEIFKKAISLWNDNLKAWEGTVRVYILLNDKQKGYKAAKFLLYLCKREGKSIQLAQTLYWLAKLSPNLEDSILSVQEATTTNPNNIEYWKFLIEKQIEAFLLKEAVDSLDTAIDYAKKNDNNNEVKELLLIGKNDLSRLLEDQLLEEYYTNELKKIGYIVEIKQEIKQEEKFEEIEKREILSQEIQKELEEDKKNKTFLKDVIDIIANETTYEVSNKEELVTVKKLDELEIESKNNDTIYDIPEKSDIIKSKENTDSQTESLEQQEFSQPDETRMTIPDMYINKNENQDIVLSIEKEFSSLEDIVILPSQTESFSRDDKNYLEDNIIDVSNININYLEKKIDQFSTKGDFYRSRCLLSLISIIKGIEPPPLSALTNITFEKQKDIFGEISQNILFNILSIFGQYIWQQREPIIAEKVILEEHFNKVIKLIENTIDTPPSNYILTGSGNEIVLVSVSPLTLGIEEKTLYSPQRNLRYSLIRAFIRLRWGEILTQGLSSMAFMGELANVLLYDKDKTPVYVSQIGEAFTLLPEDVINSLKLDIENLLTQSTVDIDNVLMEYRSIIDTISLLIHGDMFSASQLLFELSNPGVILTHEKILQDPYILKVLNKAINYLLSSENE